MKSIFTRPVFINPQAYLVIPELALIHRSTPYDFSSNKYVFQVITTGQIEGKLFQAGNEYILHLDLYSKDGNVVLGEFYLDGNSIGSTDNFILEQSNGFVTITFGGGGGNISYPGLIAAWSAKGKSNNDEDRAILKDLTGNGHDISLNGFAFNGMSGFGGYKNNFTRCRINSQAENRIFTVTANKIVVNSWDMQGSVIYYHSQDTYKKLSACKFKLSNITGIASVRFEYFTNNIVTNDTITEDGIYELTDLNGEMDSFSLKIDSIFTDKNVIIELLPEYPDALVFDGVDDYGINETIPQLSDFTIIATREFPFELLDFNRNFIMSGNRSDLGNEAWYAIERGFKPGRYTISAKKQIEITKYFNPRKSTIFQTKNTYNGVLNINASTTDLSQKGCTFGVCANNQFMSFVFYSAYLFDRSLDEQEIKAFIRKYIDPEYLLPSEEIPTPDCYYDFSQGSNDDETRDTIKDLSGNGNDAVAHNFAWNEESGYAEGGLKLDGVDDYIRTRKFSKFLNTVFCVIKSSENNKNIFEQRDKENSQQLILQSPNNVYGSFFSLEYTNYINGILNTTITATQLQNKKHLITTVLKTAVKNDGNFAIFAVLSASMKNFNNMHLYKFIGFKEKLTEEQINAIIKKYNLLDGVDEIEVS